MQFLVTAYDGTDEEALERRLRVRPMHLENVARIKETGSVICAGGILDDAGRMIGSVLVLEFESREMLDNYLASEPYVTGNVWQNIKIESCNIVRLNDEPFVKK